jgi:hypothetical protein
VINAGDDGAKLTNADENVPDICKLIYEYAPIHQTWLCVHDYDVRHHAHGRVHVLPLDE